jgi:hypothetical protein
LAAEVLAFTGDLIDHGASYPMELIKSWLTIEKDV